MNGQSIMNGKYRFLAVVALAALSLFALASPADAAFRLRLDNTTTGDSVILTDSASTGVLSFSGALGNLGINMTTALSKPVLGPVTMDLNSVNVVSSGTATLVITVEDTGFGPANPGSLGIVTNIGGTVAKFGTIGWNAWVDPLDNAPVLGPDQAPGGGAPAITFPGTSSPPASLFFDNSLGGASLAFSGTATTSVATAGGPYAMYGQATLTFGASPASTSFDAEISAVPAPAGLALAVAGLPFLGMAYLRRRKATAKAA
jgi:hypothetical protein